jgi:nucleoside-diphosphate-sugar epimerase
MRVLVTGGTGHLGHAIVSGLCGEGRRVRVLARRPGFHPGVEWIAGDLATGAGIDDAVAGVDAIVHAATNSPAARRGRLRVADLVHSPADVDLDGTRALLAAAEAAAVARFVHVSIAGLEHMKGLAYTRRKLEAEESCGAR